MTEKLSIIIAFTIVVSSGVAAAQAKKEADLKEHGRMAMGFEQDKATHHFTLTANGGIAAVTANDPSDIATRDHIRMHLEEIAAAFSKGDFEKPLMTHGEMPPGVAEMRRHKKDIKYTFEARANGGAVRIATSNEPALEAVHEFLRYQSANTRPAIQQLFRSDSLRAGEISAVWISGLYRRSGLPAHQSAGFTGFCAVAPALRSSPSIVAGSLSFSIDDVFRD